MKRNRPGAPALSTRTREEVRAARAEVARQRGLPGLTPAQQDDLDTAYSRLVELEDLLVRQDLRGCLRQLEAAAETMSGIAAALRRSIAELQRAAQLVQAVAKAVRALSAQLLRVASPNARPGAASPASDRAGRAGHRRC